MKSLDSLRGPLHRSSDGFIGGVCEGLGRHFDVNPTILRVIWLVAVFFFGTGILLYLALWWLMPHEDHLISEPTVWRKEHSGRYPSPLTRTAHDKKIFGVCGGLARAWQVDPTFVRLGALTLTMFSAGLAIFAYLIAAFVIPNSRESVSSRAHPVEF